MRNLKTDGNNACMRDPLALQCVYLIRDFGYESCSYEWPDQFVRRPDYEKWT